MPINTPITAPNMFDPTPVGSKILPEKLNLEVANTTQQTIGKMDSKYNQFDTPVAGQSLTDTPKNAKWEHPAQYSNPSDAINMVYEKIMKPDNIKQTILLLKMGTPVEAITRTVLMAGFSEGKWTPDTALLIAKPVAAIIAAVGKKAGVENIKLRMPKDEVNDPVNRLIKLKKDIDKTKNPQKNKTKQEKFINSFLSRR